MLDVIWLLMILASLAFSLVNGTVSAVSAAVFGGAQKAVTLCIALAGTMAFWLGITEIAVQAGITKKLQGLMRPLIHRLFPEFQGNAQVQEKITLNLIANFLGLGNAATPLGLAAMDAMEQAKGKGGVPSKGMVLFVVMNTASLQLLPTQMAALRSAYGSTQPFGILAQVWLCSLGAMLMVVFACKQMERGTHELSR